MKVRIGAPRWLEYSMVARRKSRCPVKRSFIAHSGVCPGPSPNLRSPLSHPKRRHFNPRFHKESPSKPITLGGWHHANQSHKHFYDTHGIGQTHVTIYNTRGDRLTAQHTSFPSLSYFVACVLAQTIAGAAGPARANLSAHHVSFQNPPHSRENICRPCPLKICHFSSRPVIIFSF